MLAVSLVHIAILTNFAVAHAASRHFDVTVARPAPVVEKIILRETTLSEKCDLGIESIARPDKEIVALREEAQKLKAALGYCQRAPKTTWETPNFHNFGTNWDAQFAFKLDDDGGGFTFGGKHFPSSTCESSPQNVFSMGITLGEEINR